MLPKMFYELLPYLYLSVGAGGFIINSAIVFVASISLMMTGALVLIMRFSYRRSIKQYQHRS